MVRDGRLRAGTDVPTGMWGFATDALLLLAIVVSLPFLILAVGAPIALAIRLLLWVGGLLWAVAHGGDAMAAGG